MEEVEANGDYRNTGGIFPRGTRLSYPTNSRNEHGEFVFALTNQSNTFKHRVGLRNTQEEGGIEFRRRFQDNILEKGASAKIPSTP